MSGLSRLWRSYRALRDKSKRRRRKVPLQKMPKRHRLEGWRDSSVFRDFGTFERTESKAMIDLRMVADDRGNLQLQYRRRDISVDAGGNLCDGGDWLEWKSVPVVYDPSQLVDRVKPDGSLTREQVQELLEDFQLNRDAYLKNVACGVSENYKVHNQGKADGVSVCLLALKEKLDKQPDEPSVDQDEPDHPF